MLAMAHGAARPRTKYGGPPLLMTSLMTRVYTDEPHRCRAAKAALELVPQDLENCNDYRGHCRREITAQGGVEWHRTVRRPCPYCGKPRW